MPTLKIVGSANRVDSDEVAHNEQPHPCLHRLLSSLSLLNFK